MSVAGEELSFRVWRPEENEQADGHTVSVTDNRRPTYRHGHVGIQFFSPSRVDSCVVRSIEVACIVPPPPETAFLRSDCNDDGEVDISDALFILGWLFTDGTPPRCIAAANANGDEGVDISDPTYLLQFLFNAGTAPVHTITRSASRPSLTSRRRAGMSLVAKKAKSAPSFRAASSR